MPQLDAFATEPCSSSLIGTKVWLDRPTDREHGCCGNVAIIGKAMSLTCTTCGAFRGWLSAEAATFIIETRARFGAPESIVLRTPSRAVGAGGEESSRAPTRRPPWSI
jgi:hypothetical protein